jgi:hypothetical protein
VAMAAARAVAALAVAVKAAAAAAAVAVKAAAVKAAAAEELQALSRLPNMVAGSSLGLRSSPADWRRLSLSGAASRCAAGGSAR